MLRQRRGHDHEIQRQWPQTWYYGYQNRNPLITARDVSYGTTNTFTGTYIYDIRG